MGAPINIYNIPDLFLTNSVLYLGMDTGFSDYTARHAVSTFGVMTISTGTFHYFGGSGFANQTTTNSYITVPSSADFTIASNDEVTIACSFLGQITSTQSLNVFSRTSAAGPNVANQYFGILKESAGEGGDYLAFFGTWNSGGGVGSMLIPLTTLSSTSWHRIVLTKNSAMNMNVYLDDQLQGTDTLPNSQVPSGNLWPVLSSDIFILGGDANVTGVSTTPFHGYIDEYSFSRSVRIPGGKAINYYNRTDAQPINFYSLP